MPTYPSDKARPALGEALVADHLFACDQNTCDIRMAYELDCPYYAAELLMGATESPATAAVLAGVADWRVRARQEFVTFAPWYQAHTVECPVCGSYVQFEARDRSVLCANCHAVVAVPAQP